MLAPSKLYLIPSCVTDLLRVLGKNSPLFFSFLFFPSPFNKRAALTHSPSFLPLIPLFFSCSSVFASPLPHWTSAARTLSLSLLDAFFFFEPSNDCSQVLRRCVIVCANWSIDQHMELLCSFFFFKQVWGFFFN